MLELFNIHQLNDVAQTTIDARFYYTMTSLLSADAEQANLQVG
jgi:hypothetical protein